MISVTVNFAICALADMDRCSFGAVSVPLMRDLPFHRMLFEAWFCAHTFVSRVDYQIY